MKTIGDLRQLIKENGEALVLGELVFTWKDGEDIDIKFQGRLIQWIQETVSDETELHAAETSQSSDIERAFEKKKNTEALEAKIVDLEKKLQENALSIGKVEAYEKLLIGRGVTISA